MITKKILNKMNLVCDLVDNGEDAVEKVKEVTYDVVLMDIHMPGISGLEATKQIRALDVKRPNDLPIIIIALSAHAMEDYRVIAKNVGMDGFLNKPLDKEQLEKVLLNAFNSL